MTRLIRCISFLPTLTITFIGMLSMIGGRRLQARHGAEEVTTLVGTTSSLHTSIGPIQALLTAMSPSSFSMGTVSPVGSRVNKHLVKTLVQSRGSVSLSEPPSLVKTQRDSKLMTEPPCITVSYPREMHGDSDLPEGLKVFIATPAYGGMVCVEYMTSVVNLVTQLKEVGFMMQLKAGESIITVGRNNLVTQFLEETDCTHLLFLDADVGFQPDAIRGLLREDKDVSFCPYPSKLIDEPKMQMVYENLEEGVLPKFRHGHEYVMHADLDMVQDAMDDGIPFIPVDAGATGCMLIKRQVFEVMAEAYPESKCRHADKKVWWNFFDTMISEDGFFLGEDIAFCRKWRKIDGEIWADIGSPMTHVNVGYMFTGALMEPEPYEPEPYDARMEPDQD